MSLKNANTIDLSSGVATWAADHRHSGTIGFGKEVDARKARASTKQGNFFN